MADRAIAMVCFRGRYYIRFYNSGGSFEKLGVDIVASIPADPKEYCKWLKSMRAKYAIIQRVLEQRVFEIRDESEPDYSQFNDFVTFPSKLPRLDGGHARFFYTINLDREVLTMNHCIHWKLGNIPRQESLWVRAIVDSIYLDQGGSRIPTISLDVCPEEHMASLALKLRQPNMVIDYAFRTVTPRTEIEKVQNVVLTRVLTLVFFEYVFKITRFGREWGSDSFPFRELTFALVSIASGPAKFHSFPAQKCDPWLCRKQDCQSDHIPLLTGWLDEKWAGDNAPLPEFGTMFHRQGKSPGASPKGTLYWHEDVLVSLTLVVDGKAITKAVTWGIKQGRTNFQIVVLSLWEVAFAEVSISNSEPLVKVSEAVDLSPLCPDYCLSTHPSERPELKSGMTAQSRRGEIVLEKAIIGTVQNLRTHFPGLAALVNFFDVAASRRAAAKSTYHLPPELYCRILDFVDYDAWKACLLVSHELRSCCLDKYRLDDQMRIVAGPVVREVSFRPLLSFNFENMETGKTIEMVWEHPTTRDWRHKCKWIPVIGSDRRVFMGDVVCEFGLTDAPVTDYDPVYWGEVRDEKFRYQRKVPKEHQEGTQRRDTGRLRPR